MFDTKLFVLSLVCLFYGNTKIFFVFLFIAKFRFNYIFVKVSYQDPISMTTDPISTTTGPTDSIASTTSPTIFEPVPQTINPIGMIPRMPNKQPFDNLPYKFGILRDDGAKEREAVIAERIREAMEMSTEYPPLAQPNYSIP